MPKYWLKMNKPCGLDASTLRFDPEKKVKPMIDDQDQGIEDKDNIIGVIAAMQVEIAAIRELMTDTEEEHCGRLLFTTGNIGKQKIVLTDCGVGPVNAAIVTQKLISEYAVKKLIHTGIAGGLDSNLETQSVILGENLTYHDFSPEILEQFSPYVSEFRSDPDMLAVARQALPADMHVHVGRIVTGNSFVASSAVKEKIIATVGGLCVDMESAAVAHTATVNNIPFLVVRSVSDMADEEADVTYEDNKSLSARAAATVVLAIVEKLDA